MSADIARLFGPLDTETRTWMRQQAQIPMRGWHAKRRVTRHLSRDHWTSAAELGHLLGCSPKDASSAVRYAKQCGATIESDRAQGHRLRGQP